MISVKICDKVSIYLSRVHHPHGRIYAKSTYSMIIYTDKQPIVKYFSQKKYGFCTCFVN